MHTIVSCYQEYLLGVLDIMTKSSDQLISAFHKLYIFVSTFIRLNVLLFSFLADKDYRLHVHSYAP